MKCPKCKRLDSDEVVDTRSPKNGAHIRRRRECGRCHHRWTTYEHLADSLSPYVNGFGALKSPAKMLQELMGRLAQKAGWPTAAVSSPGESARPKRNSVDKSG